MKTDLLLDEDFDFMEHPITKDFVEGESTKQHQDLILLVPKGGFKENPTATIGLMDFLMDSNTQELVQKINEKFTADGMVVSSIQYNDQTGDLQYDAKY